MTKLELQNKIAVLEQNISKTKNPNVLAIFQKNLEDAKQKLAALEQGTPAPAPSGGSSKLEELYAQRERFKKGLNSSNPVVQKASKVSLKKVEDLIAELEGAAPKPATPPARPAERKPRMESRQPEEVPATKTPIIPSPARRGRPTKSKTPAPAPARRGRPAKMETPAPAPARRGRPAKMETPAPATKIKRGRPAKMETPAPAPARRGRPAKMETPAPATKIKRGRPRKQEGVEVRQVSINSLTKMADSIVDFCLENGLGEPSVQDIFDIIKVVDKNKVLSRKFAKGGKISRSGKYLSKWQIQQILTDGGMKIGSDEILSGVWLKKKDSNVAQMRMGGGVGYFVIDDDILDSGKSVMLGNRRISAKNKKFQGVFQGKMVGGVMKVYDYDDEMWKAVNPNEWQQAYAEGGGVGGGLVRNLNKNDFKSKLEWFLANNNTPVTKGNLIGMAYENRTGVDTAIPQELVGGVDNVYFYVYDYQNNTLGELVDLRDKLKFSNAKVDVTIVQNGEVIHKWDLPYELQNTAFHQALHYIWTNADSIEAFDIRPLAEKYAKGGEIGLDLSGNYFSTYNFVGRNNLEKEAEKVLGKGWEAEDDVSQIQSIIDKLGGGYIVTNAQNKSEWNFMMDNYSLKNAVNDSNYDLFVILEKEFKEIEEFE